MIPGTIEYQAALRQRLVEELKRQPTPQEVARAEAAGKFAPERPGDSGRPPRQPIRKPRKVFAPADGD